MKEVLILIPKITANGYALLLNALDGVGIQFSKIVVGNGEKPGDYRVLSDLQNPILSANITDITRMEKYAILRAPMLNSDVEGRLHWTELGVFAKDPAGGSDILYGYAHTDLTGDGQGISVPSYDTNMIELAHIIYVYVGEVDDVTAIIAQSSEYASAEALRSHTADTSNPHKVDAADVGLGNVPNVTPENQKPVFSNTIASVTTEDDGTKSLPNIQNGDVMGLILQKIRSAISAFVSHLNAKNPHGLVANDVGAAASTHYHSASDINKGTLSLIRGGTGGATSEEARKNIGAAEAEHGHDAADISGTLDLARLPLDELVSLYVWAKYDGEGVLETVYGGTIISSRESVNDAYSQVPYSTHVDFSAEKVTLVNPIMLPITGSNEENIVKTLAGKYVEALDGNVYWFNENFNASSIAYTTTNKLQVTANYKRVNAPERIGFVTSKTNDTYPTNGKHTDGYWYVYHKQIGD